MTQRLSGALILLLIGEVSYRITRHTGMRALDENFRSTSARRGARSRVC